MILKPKKQKQNHNEINAHVCQFILSSRNYIYWNMVCAQRYSNPHFWNMCYMQIGNVVFWVHLYMYQWVQSLTTVTSWKIFMSWSWHCYVHPYLEKQLCQPDNNTTKAKKKQGVWCLDPFFRTIATDLQYTSIYIHFLWTELNKRIKLCWCMSYL